MAYSELLPSISLGLRVRYYILLGTIAGNMLLALCQAWRHAWS